MAFGPEFWITSGIGLIAAATASGSWFQQWRSSRPNLKFVLTDLRPGHQTDDKARTVVTVYVHAVNESVPNGIRGAELDVGLHLDNFRLVSITREDGDRHNHALGSGEGKGFSFRFESPAKCDIAKLQGTFRILPARGEPVEKKFHFGHEPPPHANGNPYRRGPGNVYSYRVDSKY